MCILLSNDEFDSAESDELLEDLMLPVSDQEQMDSTHQVCTIITNMSCMASMLCIDTDCKTARSLYKAVQPMSIAKSWLHPGDKNSSTVTTGTPWRTNTGESCRSQVGVAVYLEAWRFFTYPAG